MLEKPAVISALNNAGSGNNRKSNQTQLTWNYIFHVNKLKCFMSCR